MAITNVEELQKAISQAGHSWRVRELTPGEPPHALGWQPSGAQKIQRALVVGEGLARSRFPNLKPAPEAAMAPAAGALSGGLAGGPGQPSSFDWRTKGVIGPVRDQKQCGSCVSFATTGLVGAMAGIELGAVDLELSEADQHFDSSHGPNCSGWNNDDALDQIKSRGVSTDGTFPYMMAFDNPPVADLSTPDHEWIAHNRAEPNRAFRTYSITDYSGWTGDLRKFYLALVGPLVCGFAVYEDFDWYSGGVYRHSMGNFRGGHAVLVIGYSDIDQAWICRNSWGTTFGGPADADGTGAGFFKIAYGECNIDNEPFYGCHGVISPATLPMVTGASRSTGKLDVLAAGTDDGTYSAAWQPGDTAWRGWWRLQGGVAAPGTFIHVVSRSADHLDAFCVGTDRHVYTAAWQTGDNTWRGWWRVGDLTVAPNSSVTAVSRSANKLDIFAVGADMGVYTAAWQPGDTAWRGWWQIQGGVAAPNTSVFGVSRSADKLDIFSVGTDHGTYTAAWQAGDTSWRGWWRIQGGTVAPNTSVTAVSRGADKLDVFCVGTNHGAYTAAWQTGDSSWRGWWRIQDGVVAPDTSVFGVSRSADKLDIFSVGTDHGIYTAAWQPGFPAWHGWWRLAGGVAAPGTSVYAVSRSADRLDVFSIGTDHSICTSAWQPGFANWQEWSKMAGDVAEGG